MTGFRFFLIFLPLFSLAACTTSGDEPAATITAAAGLTQTAESISASPSETEPPPSQTPEPTATQGVTETAPPIPTSTPGPAVVTSASGDIACLFGPGTEYALGGTFQAEDEALVLGKSEDGEWFRIEHPKMERRFCWLNANETNVQGDLTSIEIAPPPDNIVTGVFVDVSPSKLEVAGCSFPAKFEVAFTIQTTGPITVMYRGVSDEGKTKYKEVKFSSGQAKSFSEDFTVTSEGDHWYRIEVTEPNIISGESSAKAVCP